jgi:hypothetical protein
MSNEPGELTSEKEERYRAALKHVEGLTQEELSRFQRLSGEEKGRYLAMAMEEQS